MDRHPVEERREELDDLAAGLFEQGERFVVAGRLDQATTIMIQVWTIAEASDPHLANMAAWNIGWLLVRAGAYDQAGEWFGRVSFPPTINQRLWAATQRALEQLCRMAAAAPVDSLRESRPTAAVRLLNIEQHTDSALLPLTIINLGGFQVRRAGAILPVCASRKAIAILRYLLTRRQRSAHKDELMELLWPDASPRNAAHSLHVAASALRGYLDAPGASYLLFEAGSYAINPATSIDDDCSAFVQLIDEAERCRRAGDLAQAERHYSDALARYGGDYYLDDPELTWAVAERERLLARYLTALEQLADVFVAQRRFEPAIGCYQRLIERDGYREDIHAQLMRCYWQLGRRGEALQQYERCTAILASDLGLEPMDEIRALYDLIARGEDVNV